MQILTTKLDEPYLVTAQDKTKTKQNQKTQSPPQKKPKQTLTKITSRILAYLYSNK